MKQNSSLTLMIGTIIMVAAFIFCIIETKYFGSNLWPQSPNELICDFIAAIFFGIGCGVFTLSLIQIILKSGNDESEQIRYPDRDIFSTSIQRDNIDAIRYLTSNIEKSDRSTRNNYTRDDKKDIEKLMGRKWKGNILILLIALSIGSGCKKESSRIQSNICYQCRDAAGNDINKFCGSTDHEAYQQATQNPFNGSDSISEDQFHHYCTRIQ